MGRVQGKVAFVTGGASGIGRAAVRTLVREGAQVVIADLNHDGAAAVARELGEAALAVPLDVTSEEGWQTALGTTIDRFGRLDIVVNSAGIGVNGSFEDTTLEDWNRVMAVNLTGTFLGCKHGVKAIKQSDGGGSVVNMSSIAGVAGVDDIAAYCASKGGVSLLTKAVALHCAKYKLGIRCNAVCPTYVDTEMLDDVAEQLGGRDIMRAGMAELVPIGRMAEAQDIANAILFLASEEAAMITGTLFLVDGGQTAGFVGRHAETG